MLTGATMNHAGVVAKWMLNKKPFNSTFLMIATVALQLGASMGAFSLFKFALEENAPQLK